MADEKYRAGIIGLGMIGERRQRRADGGEGGIAFSLDVKIGDF